jgi:hypothetical protein
VTQALSPSGAFGTECDTIAPSKEKASTPVPIEEPKVTTAVTTSSRGFTKLSHASVVVEVHDTQEHSASLSLTETEKSLDPKFRPNTVTVMASV